MSAPAVLLRGVPPQTLSEVGVKALGEHHHALMVVAQ